jgi:hypothetical protein
VQLNPRFAPAHAALAHIYGRREDTLDRALQSARTAATLEPSSWYNQLAVATVLARRGEFGQAREIAGRVGANASEPAAADGAASALTFIAESEQYQANRRRYEESRRQIAAAASSDDAGAMMRPEPRDDAERRPANRTATPEAPPAVSGTAATNSDTTPAPTQRAYSMRGRIAVLDCSAAPKVMLTLSLGGLDMKLMTPDFSRVGFFNGSGDRLPQRLTCEQLRGITARIQYTLTPGGPSDGEFFSISPQALVP